MSVLIDTNILLVIVFKREPFFLTFLTSALALSKVRGRGDTLLCAAHLILMRNPKDFIQSQMPAITPENDLKQP